MNQTNPKQPLKTYEVLCNMMLWQIRQDALPDAPPREHMTEIEKLKEDQLLKDLFAAKNGILFEDYKKQLENKLFGEQK